MAEKSTTLERLLDYIRSKCLHPGDQLPPENVLTGELNVSRVALRESLSSLKALNLVQSRRGSGYRLSSGSLNGMLASVMHTLARSGLADLSELYELRRVLEIGAIADAVENAQESDRIAVKTALENLESFREISTDDDLKNFTLAELKFHRALLKPASCKALEVVNQALEDFFNYRTLLTAKPIRLDRNDLQKTNQSHRALADAFLIGESAAAILLLRSHLH